MHTQSSWQRYAFRWYRTAAVALLLLVPRTAPAGNPPARENGRSTVSRTLRIGDLFRAAAKANPRDFPWFQRLAPAAQDQLIADMNTWKLIVSDSVEKVSGEWRFLSDDAPKARVERASDAPLGGSASAWGVIAILHTVHSQDDSKTSYIQVLWKAPASHWIKAGWGLRVGAFYLGMKLDMAAKPSKNAATQPAAS